MYCLKQHKHPITQELHEILAWSPCGFYCLGKSVWLRGSDGGHNPGTVMVRAQTLSFLAAGGKGAVLAGATDRRTGRRCQGGSGQWCGLRV